MPFRRKIRRQTMGKEAIKKSGTLNLGAIGPSSGIQSFTLIKNDAVRTPGGGATQILAVQDTASEANVGNVVKYINFRIQAGARNPPGEPEDDTSGWLEWAVVKYKESVIIPTNTLLGTQTLGNVCINAFRGDCLLQGAIPVGGDIPNTQDVALKIPKIFTKMQLGSELVLYSYFRSTNNASTATDLVAVIESFWYKLYV